MEPRPKELAKHRPVTLDRGECKSWREGQKEHLLTSERAGIGAPAQWRPSLWTVCSTLPCLALNALLTGWCLLGQLVHGGAL